MGIIFLAKENPENIKLTSWYTFLPTQLTEDLLCTHHNNHPAKLTGFINMRKGLNRWDT